MSKSFTRAPEGQDSGTAYLTLSQAAIHLSDATGWGPGMGIGPLHNGLVDGSLPAILRQSAPKHDDPAMTGNVALNPEFWKRVHWLGMPLGNPMPTERWLTWFMTGGIVVPQSAVEQLAIPLRQQARVDLAKTNFARAKSAEAYLRVNFRGLWPATDALAWIITRSASEVAKILDAMDPLAPHDFVPAWHTLCALADQHSVDGASGWKPLADAVDELCRACRQERLRSWEWGEAIMRKTPPGERPRPAKLSADDFLGGACVQGTNSCGLLGIDLVGRAEHYVLFEPDEVRSLWPARQTENHSVHEAQKPNPYEVSSDPSNSAETASNINGATPSNAADGECAKWLVKAFEADPGKKRGKVSFQTEAMAHFGSRLAVRGFLRAWDSVASEAGRTKAGRKS